MEAQTIIPAAVRPTRKRSFPLPLLIGLIAVIMAVTAVAVAVSYNRDLQARQGQALSKAKRLYTAAQATLNEHRESGAVMTGTKSFSESGKAGSLAAEIGELADLETTDLYECRLKINKSVIKSFTFKDLVTDVTVTYTPGTNDWQYLH